MEVINGISESGVSDCDAWTERCFPIPQAVPKLLIVSPISKLTVTLCTIKNPETYSSAKSQ
jgi:hypothetical protein